jgi:ABC-type sulfate transport system permease subunit
LLITNENEDVVALVPFESVKVTVIGKVPAVVGVPEITPVLVFERVTPPGSAPVTEKVPLPVPFDVARLKVKAEFIVPVNPVFGVVIATLLATHFA